MLNRECWNVYYNFFKKFCDADKYEELEMDTDSLYLALLEKNSEDIPQNETNVMECVPEITQTCLPPTQEKTLIAECAATHSKNTLRGN